MRADDQSKLVPQRIRLADDQVDVWAVSLAIDTVDGDILSAAERERRDHLVGDQRLRFERRHAALREIASRYVGASPAEVALVAERGEKPRLVDGSFALSLADSEALALVAVARARVGVDVEPVGDLPLPELDDLAAFTLSERERVAWRTAADPLLAYQRSWTRKEAYLKAIGEGLDRHLAVEVEVSAGSEAPRLLSVAGQTVSGWTLMDLDPAPGFVGALAIEHPAPKLRTRALHR
jgi:4'-phosphopantetheinyl transferase